MLGSVPIKEEMAALFLAQQRNIADALRRILCHAFQQRLEMSGHAFDSCRVEQIGVILPERGQFALLFADGELQIDENGGSFIEADGLHD